MKHTPINHILPDVIGLDDSNNDLFAPFSKGQELIIAVKIDLLLEHTYALNLTYKVLLIVQYTMNMKN
jgi:hypothetical protein